MRADIDVHPERPGLKRDGNSQRWLPEQQHAADVTACCERLLENKIFRTRIASLGGLDDLDEIRCQRLCVLAGLHDIDFLIGRLRQTPAKERPIQGADSKELIKLLNSDDPDGIRFREKLGADAFSKWFDAKNGFEPLLKAAVSFQEHAGDKEKSHLHIGLETTHERDPFASIAGRISLLKKWFPRAWAASGSFLPRNQAFEQAFNGLVALAHRLATDTRFFPPLYGRHPVVKQGEKPDTRKRSPGERLSPARKRADEAVSLCGLDGSRCRSLLDGSEHDFFGGAASGVNTIEEALLGLSLPERGSITILETHDQKGKVETALSYFFKLFRNAMVDGFFYALPEQTVITRVYPIVYEAICRTFPAEKKTLPVISALPDCLDDCNADNKKGVYAIQLSGSEPENPEPYLSGPFVMGTIGQVLLSSLPVNGAHMRATALLRQLVIIDEVNTSDAYTNSILEETLKRQVAAGGHVLIMSSALGANARHRLIQLGERSRCPGFEEAKKISFPLAVQVEYVSEDGNRLSPAPKVVRKLSEDSFFEQPNQMKPVLKLAPEIKAGAFHAGIELAPCWDDPDKVAEMGLKTACRSAKVLIIRNTLKDCLQTQASMEKIAEAEGMQSLLFGVSSAPDKNVYAPCHSCFSIDDRHTLDLALDGRFGKSGLGGGCVVSATQTVQHNADVAFDVVITDLCPVDVLCKRLSGLGSRSGDLKVIVLVPAQRDLGRYINSQWESSGPCGIGTVFPDLRFLEAAWRVLESTQLLVIPSDCRTLVEVSSHPEILKEIEKNLGAAWEKHGRKIAGTLTANVLAARINLARYNFDFRETIALFPETAELKKRILKQLGYGDRLVAFPTPLESPFGNKVFKLVIPAMIASDGDAEQKPGPVERIDSFSNGIAWAFMYGKSKYIYDNWGLRTRTGIT